MRWVLHIGAPKTGSTAIQRFLFDHRHALLDHGVLYPDVSLRGFGHHDIAFLVGGGYPPWATPQGRPLSELGDDLRAAVQGASADTLVLSSEDFYLYPRPDELRRWLLDSGLRPTDEVSVVCYLRRQDEVQVSWYNQTVKAQGNAASFAATSRRDRDLWDYAARLAPWRAAFGDPAMVVRDYGPFAWPPGDVRADFLGILGVPADAFDLPPMRANERINRDILDAQRWINRLPLSPPQKRRFHKQLIALTAETAGKGVFNDEPLLSDEGRRTVLRSYAPSNREVARALLGRDDLFEPVPTAPPLQRSGTPRGLTPAKLVVILKSLLARSAP